MFNKTPTPINYQSVLPAILPELIKLFGGSKVSTTGGAETTTVAGDISGLQQVLGQQIDPAALLATVQNLFAQGAAKVPALTTQFANATGSRVSNNSMLGQSLAILNQDLASSIANAITTNLANASTTAGRIAEGSKTTTKTAEPKTVTTQIGSAKNLAGAGLATTLGGMILNRLGKNQIVGASPEQFPAPVVDRSITFPPAIEQSYVPPPIVETPPQVFDVNSLDYTPIIDVGSNVAVESLPYFAGEFATPVADIAAESLPYFAGEAVSDVGSFIAEELPYFFGFADGGKIGTPNSGRYMDNVPRNYPNFGRARQFIVNPVYIPPLPNTPKQEGTGSQRLETVPLQERKPNEEKKIVADASEFLSPATSVVSGLEAGGLAQPGGVAGTGLTLGQALSIASLVTGTALTGAIPPTVLANFVTAMITGKTLAQLILGDQPIETQEPAPVEEAVMTSINPEAVVTSTSMPPAISVNPETGEPVTSMPPADLSGITETGEAPSGETPSGETPSGEAGTSSSSNVGDAADGGIIKRRTKLAGIDTETIKATPGEYMLPVDVVDYIGKDTLDDLVALVHTPLRSGTHG